VQRGDQVSIQEITDEFVQLNRAATAHPNPKNVALYRELQSLQDHLSRSLRGVFVQHRRLVAK